MDEYKERMVEEYNYIKHKSEKLHNMLVKMDANTLDFTPNCSAELLRKQAEVMAQYLYILEIRSEVEGIGVENLALLEGVEK